MERSYSGSSTFLVLPLTQPPKIYHPASFLSSLNLWLLITQADLIVFKYADLIQDPSLLDLVLKYETDLSLPASFQAARCAWLELCVLGNCHASPYNSRGLVGTKRTFQHKAVGFFFHQIWVQLWKPKKGASASRQLHTRNKGTTRAKVRQDKWEGDTVPWVDILPLGAEKFGSVPSFPTYTTIRSYSAGSVTVKIGDWYWFCLFS